MFAKNFADAAKVNDALTAMKKDGFIAKTHQKWFVPAAADSATVKVLDMPKCVSAGRPRPASPWPDHHLLQLAGIA